MSLDVDDLLSYNGLTRDELGSQGRTIDSPLMAGQALSLDWSITASDGPFCSDRPDDLTASQRDTLESLLEGRTQTDVTNEIATEWCGGQLRQDQVQTLVASALAKYRQPSSPSGHVHLKRPNGDVVPNDSRTPSSSTESCSR